MRRSLFTLAMLMCLNHVLLGQKSHLKLIRDFEGENFDYSVAGMVGTNDSLYVISSTPNGQGMLFRIDENGDGYKVIWEFDEITNRPKSIMANDTVIYGTTRFSANHGGALFKYSLTDYTFEIIKDFDWNEVMETQIKYITDSVLWFASTESIGDNGSIFTLNPDGTDLKKIYNDTNLEKGQNPVDFVFCQGKIYIACFNGGGIPYTDDLGTTVTSGSFIRVNFDGTGYEKIITGGDHVGTQPQSLVIQKNKLVGLFAYSGSKQGLGGQFFRSNLDGTSYDSLGALNNRSLSKLLATDSLIYGVSSLNVFGINPTDGEIRIYDNLLSNPDFGYDIAANPAYLNGSVFMAALQGGPDGGGTILKWLNEDPEVHETSTVGRLDDLTTGFNLNKLFTDPERDPLTFRFEYDEEAVAVTESKGILTAIPLLSTPVDIKITATDGWAGYSSTVVRVYPNNIVTGILKEEFTLNLYPNPSRSILRFDTPNVELIEILGIDGISRASFKYPHNEINISSLQNGVYFVRIYVNGDSYLQKIVKY